jgi:hypothetical protein
MVKAACLPQMAQITQQPQMAQITQQPQMAQITQIVWIGSSGAGAGQTGSGC